MRDIGAGAAARLRGNVLVRIAAYYAAVLLALALLTRYWPGVVPGLGAAATPAAPFSLEGPAPRLNPSARTAAVAILGAVLLALPVAWIYVLTRAKRGYQQTVVHTLVVLPLVVAGVVALVKDSLPLAFGLAGIVAAVRFRTALDDSKDAVYIFVATGLGLAAAVDLQVAAVVSLAFNAAILVLWHTDFGRTPAALDGKLAERRLRLLTEQLSRTGTFVARMDAEVFQDMSPEQLQAVADRAWRRARRHNPELPDPEGRRESLLRVRTTDAAHARDAIEPLLGEQLKRWRYGGVTHEPDGSDVLEYIVAFKRGAAPDDTLALLRAGDPAIVDAELV